MRIGDLFDFPSYEKCQDFLLQQKNVTISDADSLDKGLTKCDRRLLRYYLNIIIIITLFFRCCGKINYK